MNVLKAKSGMRTERRAWPVLLAGLLLGGCVTGGGPGVSEAPPPVDGNETVNADPFAAQSESAPEPAGEPTWNVVFETGWSDETAGQEPADLFILDGAFVVTEMDGNKVLTLPGAPVGDFGFLFGPRVKGKPVELRARILSTRKGRRMPAFAAGLGGVNAYRLRLNAAARKIQLSRGEETLAAVAHVWKSGVWTNLRFRAEPKGEEGAVVSAKVWSADEDEPADWTLVHDDPEPYAGGKCTLWGYPYAGTEILFDDLKVLAFEAAE